MQATVNATDIVRAIEVWRPQDAGGPFALCSCVYGDDDHIEEGRRLRRFELGEGIVGQSAQTGQPHIRSCEDLIDDGIDLAHSHVVSIPFMHSGQCKGVVLLACDESEGNQGAMELWRPNDRGELGLAEAWHSNLERFGLISKYVKFPRRAGLPGKVWADRFPRVMGSLGTSQQFLRAAGAKAEGLSTGIGIPLMRTAMQLDSVLVLLSANRTPIARAMEVWAMDPDSKKLKIVSADYGAFMDLAPMSRQLSLGIGEGIAVHVLRDCAPWATWDLLGVEFPRGEKFLEYGFRWGLGMPVFVGSEIRAVAVLIN
ncbi:hypothetical protein NG895_16955 [Aeoliella sp. ICT_H6.2]|uniref:GAF domain-containing protein n=1 Tax=Aeoliella straminimaris TaxID=2954799 RepID=A0A9X2FB31_9BACT|nr:hypothetical protein [Aeoliella straminimaris]MCO6045590.1 hypothetical protein [Aeoliella straminimaris]